MQSDNIIQTTAFTLNKRAAQRVHVVQLYKQADGSLITNYDDLPNTFKDSFLNRRIPSSKEIGGKFLLFTDESPEQLEQYGLTFREFPYDFQADLAIQKQIALYLLQRQLESFYVQVYKAEAYSLHSFDKSNVMKRGKQEFIYIDKLILNDHQLHSGYFSLNLRISKCFIPYAGKLKDDSLILRTSPPDKPHYQVLGGYSTEYVNADKEKFVQFDAHMTIPSYLSPVSPDQEKRARLRDLFLKELMEREKPYYDLLQEVFDFQTGQLQVVNNFRAIYYNHNAAEYDLFPETIFSKVSYNYQGEVWRKIKNGDRRFYLEAPDFDSQEQRAILFTTTEAAKHVFRQIINNGYCASEDEQEQKKRSFSSFSEMITGQPNQIILETPEAPAGLSIAENNNVAQYFTWIRETLEHSDEDYKIILFEIPDKLSLSDTHRKTYHDPHVLIKHYLKEYFPDSVSQAFKQATVLDEKNLPAESTTIVGQLLNKLGAIPCMFEDMTFLNHEFQDWQVLSIGQCDQTHFQQDDIFSSTPLEKLLTSPPKEFFTLEKGYYLGLFRAFDLLDLELVPKEQILDVVMNIKRTLLNKPHYVNHLPILIVFDDLHRDKENGTTPYEKMIMMIPALLKEFEAPVIAALLCKNDHIRLIGENSATVTSKAGNAYVKHRRNLYSSLLKLPFSWGYLSTGDSNPNKNPKTARPVPALVRFYHNLEDGQFSEQEALEFLLKCCHLKSVTSSRTALPFQLREAGSKAEKWEWS